jgi:DNA-binding winged helix-turn-helix (wHTH) protein
MGNEMEHLYEFGPYRLDPGRKLLLRNGELVALTSKRLKSFWCWLSAPNT